MELIDSLGYVYERARSASEIQPVQQVRVKGDLFIFQSCQKIYRFLEWLGKDHEKIHWIRDAVRDWIAYLDKRYPDHPGFGQPRDLLPEDAANLAQDSRRWMDALISYYREESKTVYVNERNIEATLPTELTSQLDKTSREDLDDGVLSILHLQPTPAAMILFRVAEKIVRKYYEKTTSSTSAGMSWGQIVTALQTAATQRREFHEYLDYLRTKRNEAEHPDKRFTQEESERILLQIKGLLEETK